MYVHVQWNTDFFKLSMFIEEALVGVAKGASKTMGLAKFSPKFTGLTVSFFSGYVCLDFFSQACLVELIFSRLRKSRSADLFISYI